MFHRSQHSLYLYIYVTCVKWIELSHEYVSFFSFALLCLLQHMHMRVLSRNNFPDSRFSSRSCAHRYAFLFRTTRVRIFYPSSYICISVGWSYSSLPYNILSALNTVSRLYEENHKHALRNELRGVNNFHWK